jgi:hypothetical protein
MDQFLSPGFWKSQLAAVANARWIVLILLAAVAVFVWRLRGFVDKNRIDALKDQLNARDERLLLAQQQERDVSAKLAAALASASAAQLSAAIFAKDDPKLLTVQSSIESSVDALKQAKSCSDVLSKSLFQTRHMALTEAGSEDDNHRRFQRNRNLQVTQRSDD